MRHIAVLFLIVGLFVVGTHPINAETKIYHPSDDVYISGTSGSTMDNYAVFPYLKLSGDLNKYYVIMLRFPVEKIPFGWTVSSIKLRLYYRDKIGGEPTLVKGAFTASNITTAWDEETVTWNTRPSRGSITLSGGNYYVLDSDPVYQSWDITPIAKSWLSNPETNFGMYIESSVSGWSCGFDAKENQYAPELVVEYKSSLASFVQPVINVIPGLVVATPTPTPTPSVNPEPTAVPTPTPSSSPRATISPTRSPSPIPSVQPNIAPTATPLPTSASEDFVSLSSSESASSIAWWLVGTLGGLVVACSIGGIIIVKKLKQRSLYARRTIPRKRSRK